MIVQKNSQFLKSSFLNISLELRYPLYLSSFFLYPEYLQESQNKSHLKYTVLPDVNIT